MCSLALVQFAFFALRWARGAGGAGGGAGAGPPSAMLAIMRRQKMSLYQVRTRARHWSPNYGYEPYWAGGAWVFSDPRVHAAAAAANGSTTPPTTAWPEVCGDECSYLYLDVKEVCAQQMSRFDENKCKRCNIADPVCMFGWSCDYRTDELDQYSGYRTFDTYCQFLHAQCSNPFEKKYLFVHVGACLYGHGEARVHVEPDPYLKGMHASSVAARVDTYLASLASLMDHLSTEPFG